MLACATPARIKRITAACAPTPVPDPRLVLIPDPLGLELPGLAGHLSASVSALLRSSCRAGTHAPAPVQAAPPAQASSPAQPDHRLSPRRCSSPSHCCRPHRPFYHSPLLPPPLPPPPSLWTPPHRSPFSLQASHSARIVAAALTKAHGGWTGSLARGEPDPSHGGVWRWRASP